MTAYSPARSPCAHRISNSVLTQQNSLKRHCVNYLKTTVASAISRLCTGPRLVPAPICCTSLATAVANPGPPTIAHWLLSSFVAARAPHCCIMLIPLCMSIGNICTPILMGPSIYAPECFSLYMYMHSSSPLPYICITYLCIPLYILTCHSLPFNIDSFLISYASFPFSTYAYLYTLINTNILIRTIQGKASRISTPHRNFQASRLMATPRRMDTESALQKYTALDFWMRAVAFGCSSKSVAEELLRCESYS